MRLPTISLALLLSACGTRPLINTVSLPASALAPKPLPVLEGTSNRSVGIYAIECKAALESITNDVTTIRNAVK